jgi:1,4-dihydroxy-2-naphthoate octaprenyltransferase
MAVNNLKSITRANFLLLTVVIVAAGLSASLYAHGIFNPFDALLVLIGALFTHMAANVFNNYFDYRSKIDAKTTKTPFSGGVSILVEGKMKPSTAFVVGLLCLIGAAVIGAYFLMRSLYPLFPILLYGLVAICIYTPVIARIPALSEIVAGTGFGFMGLGAYVTQARIVDAAGIAVFVPVSILVGLLLFLNEFPDVEADKTAGRRHVVILFGRKTSAAIYVIFLAGTYLSILLSVAMTAVPLAVLVSLITTPIAYKAMRIVLKNYDRLPELVPALGLNVIVILSTIALLTAGFLIGVYV